MNVFASLFLEFFKIGLFAIGGGLATIPFLKDIAARYDWFDVNMLFDMIAISESTPGPIGVNMATFAGFRAGGMLGGIVATLSLILPSVIIAVIVANFISRFKENKIVQDVFYGLRAAVVGMVIAIGFQMTLIALFGKSDNLLLSNIFTSINYKAAVLFAIILLATKKLKIHPVFFVLIGGILGALFKI